MMTRRVGVAWILAAIAGASLGTADPAASQTTALQVIATGAPQRVHGSDGREHIDYDLVITNNFTVDVTLTSLVVRGGGKNLLTLEGDALAAVTHETTGLGEPTTSIPASSAVATLVDIVLPRSAGRTVPKRLSHRITYTFPPGAPGEAIIGSRTVDAPKLRVDRRVPIEVAAPLRGDGWLSANACCDPTLNHRSTLLAANGTFVTPEIFAVDYIRLVDGRFYVGDGTQNADWFGFGAPIRAATRGRVVSVRNDMPEVPPLSALENPTVTKPSDFGGNGVVVKVRPGQFAHYYHMQTGSVRVEVGQRVRTGQKLGLLGNTGNTSGAHLHFGFTDGRNALTTNSLPFEIDRFRFEGTASAGPTPGELTVSGTPRDERRSHPLATSVSDYSR